MCSSLSRSPRGSVDWNINTTYAIWPHTASLPTWERGLKSVTYCLCAKSLHVAPHVGAWIEMIVSCWSWFVGIVAPHVGAWIEMYTDLFTAASILSLPTWERGLKYTSSLVINVHRHVAPHVGAWIEILCNFFGSPAHVVAPHVGAWIEISLMRARSFFARCRSPRGSVDWNLLSVYFYVHPVVSRSPRGSVDWNTCMVHVIKEDIVVAPHVGAWIEM